MASLTRAPTSDEAVSGTWSGSAGTRYQAVDDYPDASGADFLTHGTTAGVLTFGFSAISLPAIAVISAVRVNYYDQKTASQNCNFGARLKVGGNYYNASTHNPSNGTWVSRQDSWATNPKSGAAWTVDDVNGIGSNALEAFGFNSSDANPTIRAASAELEVVYTLQASTGVAIESDVALALTGEKSKDVGVALEEDVALEPGAVEPTGWALPQGINFRSTSNGDTDPAGTAALLSAGSNSTPVYPISISPNGVTFNIGWDVNGEGTRDRVSTGTGVGVMLDGIHFDGGSPTNLSIELPTPGTYRIWGAFGDASFDQNFVSPMGIYDGGTLGGGLTGATLLADMAFGATPTNNYRDAAGNLMTRAAWIASNGGEGGGTPIDLDFTTTSFKFAGLVSHLRIQRLETHATASPALETDIALAPLTSNGYPRLRGTQHVLATTSTPGALALPEDVPDGAQLALFFIRTSDFDLARSENTLSTNFTDAPTLLAVSDNTGGPRASLWAAEITSTGSGKTVTPVFYGTPGASRASILVEFVDDIDIADWLRDAAEAHAQVTDPTVATVDAEPGDLVLAAIGGYFGLPETETADWELVANDDFGAGGNNHQALFKYAATISGGTVSADVDDFENAGAVQYRTAIAVSIKPASTGQSADVGLALETDAALALAAITNVRPEVVFSDGIGGAGVDTLTLGVDATGCDLLEINISWYRETVLDVPISVSGVTHAGNACTQRFHSNDNSVVFGNGLAKYYIVNPAAGMEDVVLTLSGVPNGSLVMEVIGWATVNTSNPYRGTTSSATRDGGAANVSGVVTSYPNDTVSGFAVFRGGSSVTPTITGGQSAVGSQVNGSGSNAVRLETFSKAGASSVGASYSYSPTGTYDAGIILDSIRAATDAELGYPELVLHQHTQGTTDNTASFTPAPNKKYICIVQFTTSGDSGHAGTDVTLTDTEGVFNTTKLVGTPQNFNWSCGIAVFGGASGASPAETTITVGGVDAVAIDLTIAVLEFSDLVPDPYVQSKAEVIDGVNTGPHTLVLDDAPSSNNWVLSVNSLVQEDYGGGDRCTPGADQTELYENFHGGWSVGQAQIRKGSADPDITWDELGGHPGDSTNYDAIVLALELATVSEGIADVGVALETGVALALTGEKAVAPGLALELDASQYPGTPFLVDVQHVLATSSTPGALSLPDVVPADAQLALIFIRTSDFDLTNPANTLSTDFTDTPVALAVSADTGGPRAALWAAEVTSFGAGKTITPVFYGTPGANRASIFIVFIKDVNVADWLRDAAEGHVQVEDPLTVSVDAVTGDLVLTAVGAYYGFPETTTSDWKLVANDDYGAGGNNHQALFRWDTVITGGTVSTDIGDFGNIQYRSIVSVSIKPISSAESSQDVGLALETDAALALVGEKDAATGLSLETDIGLSLTGEKDVATDLSLETDTALTLTGEKDAAVGLSLETDTAFALTGEKDAAAGLSLETDTAFALTGEKIATVGLALEIDVAIELTQEADGSVGRADELDTAFALTVEKSASTGPALESNVAFALTGEKSRDAGLVLESDVALTLIGEKAVAIGLAIENDVALTLTGEKAVTTGLAFESDVAFALAGEKVATPGLALENDVALSLTGENAADIGLSLEIDTALALSTEKSTAAGLSLETDIALSLTLEKDRNVGLSLEVDEALELSQSGSASVGRSDEADTAFSLSGEKIAAVGTSLESDIALALASEKSVTTSVALESDTALPLTVEKDGDIGVALENDVALSLVGDKSVSAGLALEVDTALELEQGNSTSIGRANELDTALSLIVVKSGAITVSNESDIALAPNRTVSKEIGLAIEENLGLAALTGKSRQHGLSTEIDIAQSTFLGPSQQYGVSYETDTALQLNLVKSGSIEVALESDMAIGLVIYDPALIQKLRATGIYDPSIAATAMLAASVKATGIKSSTTRMIGVHR